MLHYVMFGYKANKLLNKGDTENPNSDTRTSNKPFADLAKAVNILKNFNGSSISCIEQYTLIFFYKKCVFLFTFSGGLENT